MDVFLKVRLSSSQKICVICFNETSLKVIKNATYFILKALKIKRYSNFCLELLENLNLCRHNLVNKQLQYTYCQISHEIKINQMIKFSSRTIREMRYGDYFQTFYVVKANDMQLSFNIFRQPSPWYTIKIICVKFYTIDPDIWSILNFQKRI